MARTEIRGYTTLRGTRVIETWRSYHHGRHAHAWEMGTVQHVQQQQQHAHVHVHVHVTCNMGADVRALRLPAHTQAVPNRCV